MAERRTRTPTRARRAIVFTPRGAVRGKRGRAVDTLGAPHSGPGSDARARTSRIDGALCRTGAPWRSAPAIRAIADTLSRELGTRPQPETDALAKRIRDDRR